jgi:hypothetical protein
MREWLWHARAVRDDHTSGKHHITLQYGQASLGLPRKALLSSQHPWRLRVWMGAGLRGVLYTVLSNSRRPVKASVYRGFPLVLS